MARGLKFAMKGQTQLRQNLRSLPTALASRQVDKVATDALDPMLQETIAQARRRRQQGKAPKGGHLDQNVVVRKIREKSVGTKRVYWVTFRRRGRRIAHLVEFGTAPHAQPARGILHPGARPYPFARPAYEAKKLETLRRVGPGLWAIIAATISKGGKRV